MPAILPEQRLTQGPAVSLPGRAPGNPCGFDRFRLARTLGQLFCGVEEIAVPADPDAPSMTERCMNDRQSYYTGIIESYFENKEQYPSPVPSRSEVEAIPAVRAEMEKDPEGMARAITNWLAAREAANARRVAALKAQAEAARNPTNESPQFNPDDNS
jgi:hypothetical protein